MIAATALLLALIAAVTSSRTVSPPHAERALEILAPQAAIMTEEQLMAPDRPSGD
jgi:hypothetical protein